MTIMQVLGHLPSVRSIRDLADVDWDIYNGSTGDEADEVLGQRARLTAHFFLGNDAAWDDDRRWLR